MIATLRVRITSPVNHRARMVQSDLPQALPAEIRVESLSADATRFILPRRPLGHYRWFAIVPLAFGVFALVFFWQSFGIFAVVRFNPIMLPLMACGAFLLVSAGLAPIVVAAAMLFGHSSIVVERGKLRTIEHVGPLRWRRTFRSATQEIKAGCWLRCVRRFPRSGRGSRRSPDRNRPAGFDSNRDAASGKPGNAAAGYPRESLEPHESANWLGSFPRCGRVRSVKRSNNRITQSCPSKWPTTRGLSSGSIARPAARS